LTHAKTRAFPAKWPLRLEIDVPQEQHDPRQTQVIMVQRFHPIRRGGKSGPAPDSAFAALKAIECQHKIERLHHPCAQIGILAKSGDVGGR